VEAQGGKSEIRASGASPDSNGPCLRQSIERFLFATTHPINLAIFRIVVFWQLAFVYPPRKLIGFGSVNSEMMDPPFGSAWLFDLIPPEPQSSAFVIGVFFLSSLLACAGYLTRLTAPIASFTAIWALGVPQLFGKVSHYHYLVWFALILSFSPCAQILSVDSVIRRFRHRRDGSSEGALASPVTKLPLHLCWAMLALFYFFAGFWKLQALGLDWIFSNNLERILWNRWIELGIWQPPIRLDQHPAAMRLAAAATLLFELGFPFLLLSPRGRTLAFVVGISFHSTISFLMEIHFTPLRACYVMLLDWPAIFSRMGRGFRTFAASAAEINRRPPELLLPLVLVGAILFFCEVIVGAHNRDGWPFSVAPHFGYYATAEPELAVLRIRKPNGSTEDRLTLARDLPFDPATASRNLLTAANTKDPALRCRKLTRLLRMLRTPIQSGSNLELRIRRVAPNASYPKLQILNERLVLTTTADALSSPPEFLCAPPPN